MILTHTFRSSSYGLSIALDSTEDKHHPINRRDNYALLISPSRYEWKPGSYLRTTINVVFKLYYLSLFLSKYSLNVLLSHGTCTQQKFATSFSGNQYVNTDLYMVTSYTSHSRVPVLLTVMGLSWQAAQPHAAAPSLPPRWMGKNENTCGLR